MSILWRSPLLDASDHASGARAMVRALDAAGVGLSLQQTPWGTPSVVSEAELAWLARRDVPAGHVGTTVQRTVARLLTPYVDGIRVAWTAFAGTAPDRETLMRLRQMDAVWVPSGAQRGALVAAGLEEARVLALPEPVDLVDVFRRSSELPAVLADVLAMPVRPHTLWLQLGLSDQDVARQAEAAGITVVMDRCLKVDHQRYG